MMKKKYEKFMTNKQMVKEVDERYQVQFHFQEWHDYDVAYAKKEGLELGKQEMAISLYEFKYQQNGDWLKQWTLKQIDKFNQLIITDIGSEELKKRVLG